MNKEELQRKVEAVKQLNEIIKANQSNIEEVRYEVYQYTEQPDCTVEFIVVDYKGGNFAVRNSSGNGFITMFREINKLLDGGYYTEVDYYNTLKNNGKMTKLF